MSAPRNSWLAPFGVSSFRFQWPADLAVSWAFEMETLILGWYVLVQTESVLMLTLFASLQYVGTLLSPMFGVMGDRLGHRNVLCAMRGIYALLAVTLTIFAYLDSLTPTVVFAIALVVGLIRPSDVVMRYSIIGATMPSDLLISAMSLARTTMDSARIAGAMAGAGMAATVGMAYAYTTISTFYAISFVLTLRIKSAPGRGSEAATRSTPWHDLKNVLTHVWDTPHLLAAMCLAFLLNLTAFPLVQGLLPYVAKHVYRADQTVLGYLVAASAGGALLGSVMLSRYGRSVRPGRTTLIFAAAWYACLAVFAQQQHLVAGLALLMCAGTAQTLCLVPLSTMLLRTADERLRGRILGMRSLAVYGLPLGLMAAGPLISHFDYRATATLYCVLGLACVAVIAARWRRHLWPLDAMANRR